MTSITVIIPTLNEKEAIQEVIKDIPKKELQDRDYNVEIMAVDGGSSDGTIELLEDSDVELIHAGDGKTEGVKKGLKNTDSDYIFLIDGDGTYPAEKIIDMVKDLEDGSEMVLGNRFGSEMNDGAMSTKNMVGNKILTGLANRLYGTKVSDLCTGLRGFKFNGFNAEEIPGEGFELEAALHSIFSKKDISEIPISYKQRKGKSKLVTSDGFKIAMRLIKEKF